MVGLELGLIQCWDSQYLNRILVSLNIAVKQLEVLGVSQIIKHLLKAKFVENVLPGKFVLRVIFIASLRFNQVSPVLLQLEIIILVLKSGFKSVLLTTIHLSSVGLNGNCGCRVNNIWIVKISLDPLELFNNVVPPLWRLLIERVGTL